MTYPEPGRPTRRGSLALGLVLGIATGLVALWAVWALLLDGGGRAEPAPIPSRTPLPSVTRTPTPSVTPSRSASPTPTATPTATPSDTPSPTPSETSAAGAVTELQSGTIFVVLDSLPKASASFDQAQARAAELGAGRPRQAVVVDSDAVAPTLNGGYWAVGFPGAANRDQVAAICADFGREVGPACYSRPVQ